MSDSAPDLHRRRFVHTVGGGAIIAALPLSGCESLSASIPQSANAAWTVETASTDRRIQALSWAILAPNPHNRQPWLIELVGEDTILVRIDSTRLLPHTDPFSRQILIGTGAMLGLLDIAAAALGYQTRTEWFDEGEFGESVDNRPVARITLQPAESGETDANLAMLFEQIPQRRTVRAPYDLDHMPAQTFADELSSLAARMSLPMGLITRDDQPAQSSQLASLVKEAWAIELRTPETYMESIRLLRVGSREIAQHRDGIAITSPFLVLIDRLGLFDRSAPPARDSRIIQGQIDDFNELVDATPAFFTLTSGDNSRGTQLQVGKAYVEAQLRATAHGLVMHPVSQALQEYPEMSESYRRLHDLVLPAERSTDGTLQMLCRIGYLPAGESLPVPSPRRGLSEHWVS